eukprot:TRINITY_DN2031_c0_g1_i2.p1 TRINITY_DN2031_c0_g1~~TRINITY_DN2031_c0_g1_i2.p1  ORF type:complete len:126 (-),score=14.67 TRINITY_DN2031_c0_g1_i2:83-460(-)
MSLGKCVRCNKTCYQLEGLRVGPPTNIQVFHKGCFKCQNEGCSWQLTLNNYKYYEDKVFCPNHCPMTGRSNKIEGEDFARVHGHADTDAVATQTALNAPKLGVVNEQIRGDKVEQVKGQDSVYRY